MTQLSNQQKSTRKVSFELSVPSQLQQLRVQNKKLKDSIYLQQKSINQFLQQKKVYQNRLKESDDQILMMSYEIAELRKKLLTYIKQPHNLKKLDDDKGKQGLFMRDSVKIQKFRRTERKELEDIVLEVPDQEENSHLQKAKQLAKSPVNASKLVSCIKKMSSLEGTEEKTESTLVKSDNRSQPMLRTLRDLRLSAELNNEFREQEEFKPMETKKPARKKSYFEKIMDNEHNS